MENEFADMSAEESYAKISAQEPDTDPAATDEVDYVSQLAAQGVDPASDTVPDNFDAERKAARAGYLDELRKDVQKMRRSWEEQERKKREYDASLPFAERTLYRTRHMYLGWQLEPVEVQAENFAITRSNYGYRVLNSPEIGIIDVDFAGDCGGISVMHVTAQQKEAIANLRDWVASHPEQSWRIYRTAAGLRMIRTDAPQPLDESYDGVRDAIVDADRLYCDLCKEQNAFRARISPKVHRIGADYPGWSPYAYPEGFWDHSPTQEEILAYEMKAAQYKVAELIEVVGAGDVHPALVSVLDCHDKSCHVESTLPMETPAASEYESVSGIAELVAFNAAYRPEGMAPDTVWASLSGDLQDTLRFFGSKSNAQKAIAFCKRLDELAQKWDSTEHYQTFDTLYSAAFAKYKEDAKRYQGEDGHWVTPDPSTHVSDYPVDPRYWYLGMRSNVGPGGQVVSSGSAIIRFLPSSLRGSSRPTRSSISSVSAVAQTT